MSREYRGRKIVIYPEYLDSKKSRSEGRRIPLKQAVPNPTLEEIARAAEELGLNPIIEEEKAYPRDWWGRRGRVIVDKSGSKLETLRRIAEQIKSKRRMSNYRY